MRAMLLFTLLVLSCSAAARSNDRVASAVHQLDPTAVIDVSKPSPIPGLTLVSVRGQTLLVSKDGRYVIQGELFDLKGHRDISEDVRSAQRAAAIDTIPVSDRILFAARDPKYTVVMFFDPECAFCRQMMGNIAQYQEQGISVAVVAYPRNGLNSTAFARADAIWCSPDRREALIEALSHPITAPKSCATIIRHQFEVGQALSVPGTPTLMDEHGHYLGGYLTPGQLLDRLRSGPGTPGAGS